MSLLFTSDSVRVRLAVCRVTAETVVFRVVGGATLSNQKAIDNDQKLRSQR